MEDNDKYETVASNNDLDQEMTQPAADQQELEGLKRELSKLKKDNEGLQDRLLRNQAEFENYKKRLDREKAEFVQYASSELLKELLNVLDSFDRAVKTAAVERGGADNTLRGFELINKQLHDTLTRFGLKPIEATGKPFDPNFHQAVSTQASEELDENTVVEEMRKGYTLHGRLLRPAMVSVSVKG